MPKVPPINPNLAAATKRAADPRQISDFRQSIIQDMEGGSPEDRYTEQLNNWKPNVKAANMATLKRAVTERGKFAHEVSEWYAGDSHPRGHSRYLWNLDGAAAVAKELRDMGDLVLRHYVLQARLDGETWGNIASHLNITRQAAMARYASDAAVSDDEEEEARVAEARARATKSRAARGRSAKARAARRARDASPSGPFGSIFENVHTRPQV